ncbi:MAG: hypothetical protein HC906_00265 [Bacteroidales bacterium]|nr:hypothetical protein [Bacteroidales bacterium]
MFFLDGTELGEYALNIHPEFAYESEALRKKVTGKINDRPWNGGISQKQKNWLRGRLDDAKQKNQVVIIFSHFPLLPQTIDLILWNNEEIIDLIENYKNVKAYISGHYHEGGYAGKAGIHYVIQKAMSDTHENSFAIMEIYPDEITIKGYGNADHLNLKINQ